MKNDMMLNKILYIVNFTLGGDILSVSQLLNSDDDDFTIIGLVENGIGEMHFTTIVMINFYFFASTIQFLTPF